jgi:uncharacterized protein DUF6152
MRIVILVIVLVAAAAPLDAHHSFAAIYDQSKPLHLEGRVENIEWTNPHVMMTLVTRATDGAETRWSLEMGAPRVLTNQFGWTTTSVQNGDLIVVDGFRARDGSQHAAAVSVTTHTGQRLRAVRPFR